MSVDAFSVTELRKRYNGREVYIVATDKENLTMRGEDGVTYHQRPDHTWSAEDTAGEGAGESEGALRWQGSAFHGYGIRLKPLYVMHDGSWINVFTGKREATHECN